MTPLTTTKAGRALVDLFIADDEVPGQLDWKRMSDSILAIEAEARAEGAAECREELDALASVSRHDALQADNARLRAALQEIEVLCDLSIEDMREQHGSEHRVLLAVIPTKAHAALAEATPDGGVGSWEEGS